MFFRWEIDRPCLVHPGRACFLKYVPWIEQVELFETEWDGILDGSLDSGGDEQYLDIPLSVSAFPYYDGGI